MIPARSWAVRIVQLFAEGAQFGRAAKVVTDKLLKGLGMTEADFADLPDEQKDKIESLIPIIAERYTKTKAGDKQLQADLIEIGRAHV